MNQINLIHGKLHGFKLHENFDLKKSENLSSAISAKTGKVFGLDSARLPSGISAKIGKVLN